MKGQVNQLPQQAELTLVTEQANEAETLKQLKEQRYQLMARIAIRTILST